MKRYKITLTIATAGYAVAERWEEKAGWLHFLDHGEVVAMYPTGLVTRVDDCTHLPCAPEFGTAS